MNTSSDGGLLMTVDTQTFDREDLGSVFKRGLYSNAQAPIPFKNKPVKLSDQSTREADNPFMEPYHHEESKASSRVLAHQFEQDLSKEPLPKKDSEEAQSKMFQRSMIVVIVIMIIVAVGIVWLLATVGNGNVMTGLKNLFKEDTLLVPENPSVANVGNAPSSMEPNSIPTNGLITPSLALMPDETMFTPAQDQVEYHEPVPLTQVPEYHPPEQQNVSADYHEESLGSEEAVLETNPSRSLYSSSKAGISGTAEGRHLYDELGGREQDEYLGRVERPEYNPETDETLNIEKNRTKKISQLYADHEAKTGKPDPNYGVHGLVGVNNKPETVLPAETLAPTRDENFRRAHEKKHLLMASSTKAVHDIYSNKCHQRTEKMPEFAHDSKTINGNGISYVNIHDQKTFEPE